MWSLSNGSVGRIDFTTDSTVVVTAIGVGQTSVIASSHADAAKKAAAVLTVVPVPPGTQAKAPRRE